ncbi:MAG: RidA family protein [Alphaproteobacteria bacterium]|nr:RidA family protein [Alphaproteobacteria bacterium]MBU2272359.1 RidA family protein [Alphaproteobacteria bacterium]MBU2417204.1 RidA family protein [Alphaproteobacteria bacterium]
MTLSIRPLTGDGSPPVEGSYPQAVEVTGATRWLYLSGKIPVAPDGSLADDFTGQCEQVWDNIETQLAAAGMTLDNLVKVTTFLSDRDWALENREVRVRRLAGRQPALTVIVTGIFDEAWLVEIEAVAAA